MRETDKTIETMKQALEALQGWNYVLDPKPDAGIITALRAAIAEAAMQRVTDVQQEMEQHPIGYLWPTGRHCEFRYTQQKRDGVDGTPVYTNPPRREWVGLTDEDIEQEFGFIDELLRDCVQRTEAKLKEKNA